jgi:hypothetical protein
MVESSSVQWPTASPTYEPTASPTPGPTVETGAPTATPTPYPTPSPTEVRSAGHLTSHVQAIPGADGTRLCSELRSDFERVISQWPTSAPTFHPTPARTEEPTAVRPSPAPLNQMSFSL